MTSSSLEALMGHQEISDLTETEKAAIFLPLILQYLESNVMGAHFVSMEELAGASIDCEMEVEQRILVDMSNFPVSTWETDVEDIYDSSGTFRFRSKCGALRLSMKIPVPDRNTYRTKCCLRVEVKPSDDAQRVLLSGLRKKMLEDEKLRVLHKRGTRIRLTDGRMAWLNQNDAGKSWIEVDGSDYEVENFLPEGITYQCHMKSMVRSVEVVEPTFDQFLESVNHNTQVTSRTAKGVVDTSVSSLKNGTNLGANEVAQQVLDNSQVVSRYIWENKFVGITSAAQLKAILMHIAELVNAGSENGLKLRTWDVKYGYKIPADSTLDYALDELFNQAWQVLRVAEKGKVDPYKAAAWLEWMVDGGLHPWADGCGRIAKAWSAFFLCRMERPLPQHESRDSYYKPFNEGLGEFVDYYVNLASKIQ